MEYVSKENVTDEVLVDDLESEEGVHERVEVRMFWWRRYWVWGVVVGVFILLGGGWLAWSQRTVVDYDREYPEIEYVMTMQDSGVTPTVRVFPSVTPTPGLSWERVMEEGEVSPDGKWVVMRRSDSEQSPNYGPIVWSVWEFVLGDVAREEIVKRWERGEILIDEDRAGSLKVLGWKGDSSQAWLVGTYGNMNGAFFVLDVEAQEISVVGDRERGFDSGEMDLNLETGQVVAGTYTFKFDEYDYQEYLASGRIERLRVIDLFTGDEQVLMEAKTHIFRPRWVDEKTIEFDSPEGGRVRREV